MKVCRASGVHNVGVFGVGESAVLECNVGVCLGYKVLGGGSVGV